MANSGTTNGRHQVATKETELSLSVNIFQRPHQMRCMQITRGLANYQIVLHLTLNIKD